jgi:hypothetical protein
MYIQKKMIYLMCENNGFLLTCKMVALLPMKVVIHHKLRIQQFHENHLIILQEMI